MTLKTNLKKLEDCRVWMKRPALSLVATLCALSLVLPPQAYSMDKGKAPVKNESRTKSPFAQLDEIELPENVEEVLPTHLLDHLMNESPLTPATSEVIPAELREKAKKGKQEKKEGKSEKKEKEEKPEKDEKSEGDEPEERGMTERAYLEMYYDRVGRTGRNLYMSFGSSGSVFIEPRRTDVRGNETLMAAIVTELGVVLAYQLVDKDYEIIIGGTEDRPSLEVTVDTLDGKQITFMHTSSGRGVIKLEEAIHDETHGDISRHTICTLSGKNLVLEDKTYEKIEMIESDLGTFSRTTTFEKNGGGDLFIKQITENMEPEEPAVSSEVVLEMPFGDDGKVNVVRYTSSEGNTTLVAEIVMKGLVEWTIILIDPIRYAHLVNAYQVGWSLLEVKTLEGMSVIFDGRQPNPIVTIEEVIELDNGFQIHTRHFKENDQGNWFIFLYEMSATQTQPPPDWIGNKCAQANCKSQTAAGGSVHQAAPLSELALSPVGRFGGIDILPRPSTNRPIHFDDLVEKESVGDSEVVVVVDGKEMIMEKNVEVRVIEEINASRRIKKAQKNAEEAILKSEKNAAAKLIESIIMYVEPLVPTAELSALKFLTNAIETKPLMPSRLLLSSVHTLANEQAARIQNTVDVLIDFVLPRTARKNFRS